MEKYVAPEMEVVEFDNEDVITSSGCDLDGCVAVGGPGDPGGYA